MKKLLYSVATLGAAAAVAVLGTGAFFSDTETSVDNTFVAGDIDLKIDNSSYALDCNIPGSQTCTGTLVANTANSWPERDLTEEQFFDFVDLKPGDYSEDTISVHVGSNDAWVCAAAQLTEDHDNTYTEPELDDDTTQNLVDATAADGELDDELNFAFWVDDGDNVYEVGESVFLEGPLSGLGEAGKITLADSLSSVLGENEPVPGDSTFYIGKIWCMGTLTANQLPDREDPNLELNNPVNRGTGWSCDGSEVDNAAQTDLVMGDLQFYAEQSRNNPEFTCASWTPEWPEEELPLVAPQEG